MENDALLKIGAHSPSGRYPSVGLSGWGCSALIRKNRCALVSSCDKDFMAAFQLVLERRLIHELEVAKNAFSTLMKINVSNIK